MYRIGVGPMCGFAALSSSSLVAKSFVFILTDMLA